LESVTFYVSCFKFEEFEEFQVSGFRFEGFEEFEEFEEFEMFEGFRLQVGIVRYSIFIIQYSI
jgi:hypothetical protein